MRWRSPRREGEGREGSPPAPFTERTCGGSGAHPHESAPPAQHSQAVLTPRGAAGQVCPLTQVFERRSTCSALATSLKLCMWIDRPEALRGGAAADIPEVLWADIR